MTCRAPRPQAAAAAVEAEEYCSGEDSSDDSDEDDADWLPPEEECIAPLGTLPQPSVGGQALQQQSGGEALQSKKALQSPLVLRDASSQEAPSGGPSGGGARYKITQKEHRELLAEAEGLQAVMPH